tara:strand:- start:159 stop:347 length:189 start_codon:yes stop_codon:yes gene_type:complete
MVFAVLGGRSDRLPLVYDHFIKAALKWFQSWDVIIVERERVFRSKSIDKQHWLGLHLEKKLT